ncbi:hypothetical protein NDU88_002542 [Pleurodeles waltl]|uniref:Uncharacterized protein n=1 Tax=Pleurodeles waltl TaxID=8319 RepID=A0AAV7VBK4_PLEWA|nr:hypothetical protein NDU88_002542 [Pleurodeles waltl]
MSSPGDRVHLTSHPHQQPPTLPLQGNPWASSTTQLTSALIKVSHRRLLHTSARELKSAPACSPSPLGLLSKGPSKAGTTVSEAPAPGPSPGPRREPCLTAKAQPPPRLPPRPRAQPTGRRAPGPPRSTNRGSPRLPATGAGPGCATPR